MGESKKVRVDSFRPDSRKEVDRLLAEGWEIDDVETEDHQSCHDSSVGSYETVYYIMKKIS